MIGYMKGKYENILKLEGMDKRTAYEYLIRDEKNHASSFVMQACREEENGHDDMSESSMDYAEDILIDIQMFKSYRRKYINLKGEK